MWMVYLHVPVMLHAASVSSLGDRSERLDLRTLFAAMDINYVITGFYSILDWCPAVAGRGGRQWLLQCDATEGSQW